MLGYLLLCLVGLCIIYFVKTNPSWHGMPPGPKGIPLIGNLLDLLREEPIFYYAKISKKYGPVSSVHLGKKRIVLLSSSYWVKKAFVHQGIEFSGRPQEIALSYIANGRGIVMSTESVNFHARRTLMGCFKDFGFGKNDIETYIDMELESYMQTLKAKDLNKYNPHIDLAVSMLNITWNMLGGDRFHPDDPLVKWLVETIGMSFELVKQGDLLNYTFFLQFIITFMRPKAMQVGWSVARRFSMFRRSIEEHKKLLDDAARRNDFIFNFLEEQRKHQKDPTKRNIFSDSQLSWILSDVFIASIETTVTSLRWSLIMLVKHPDIQDKLHKEIKAVSDPTAKFSLSDKSRTPFVEAFINEVLRMYPPIPILMHAASKDTSLGEYNIPNRTWVIINLWDVLNNEEVWGDPENFRPERFLDDKGTFVKSDHQLPFFIGRRNCIGEPLAVAELFLFLTCILQNYYVRKYDDGAHWNTGVKYGLSLTPHNLLFKFIPKFSQPENR